MVVRVGSHTTVRLSLSHSLHFYFFFLVFSFLSFSQTKAMLVGSSSSSRLSACAARRDRLQGAASRREVVEERAESHSRLR